MTTATAPIDPKNPPAVHEWTGPTGVHFRDVRSPMGFYFHDTTAPEVVRALESAHASQVRIRIFHGDIATGRDWCEEWHTFGTVGASCGWKRSAILIQTRRSRAGGCILADCIVRITANGRELYRHPLYQVPEFRVRPADGAYIAKGYHWAADRMERGIGINLANFKTEAQAVRWIAFMRGERAGK